MDAPGRRPEGAVDGALLHDEIARLRADLELATRQSDESFDLLRQVRADFAAHRRRSEEERVEQVAGARNEILVQVLPILDELRAALADRPEQRLQPGWAARIELTAHKLDDILRAVGVQRIEALGAVFNPWEHEAVHVQTGPKLEDERVVAVIRDGYRIGGRVIRPAQVVVARQAR